MAEFAVAGSDNDNPFVVANFLPDPTHPHAVSFPSPFSGGCVVDCSGLLVAVGNYRQLQFAIYNIDNPATPKLNGVFDIPSMIDGLSFSGIGALSLDGTNLLVGDYNGGTMALFDVSRPEDSLGLGLLRLLL